MLESALRGVAQPGSALAWGARGREFESRRPDQSIVHNRAPSPRDISIRIDLLAFRLG